LRKITGSWVVKAWPHEDLPHRASALLWPRGTAPQMGKTTGRHIGEAAMMMPAQAGANGLCCMGDVGSSD
jgi:hypothetical protein